MERQKTLNLSCGGSNPPSVAIYGGLAEWFSVRLLTDVREFDPLNPRHITQKSENLYLNCQKHLKRYHGFIS